MNMARLGHQSKLVATVGQDDMGQYLLDFVQQLPVDCQSILRCSYPTTLILVTRSASVANFEAYRGADYQIIPFQINRIPLSEVSIFHTTCFALSLEPARSTILTAAKEAVDSGCALSIDANYAHKIWPNRNGAQQIVASYCQLGSLIKMSEVDWERLYGNPLTEPRNAIDFLLDLGAKEVCLTLGEEGCWVGNQQEKHFVPSRAVEVKDTTGAGDAFWSGYLTAFLDGHTLKNRAKAGRKMAELKIQRLGPLPPAVNRTLLYEDFTATI
ncbi:MAG: carbohydrate kinase family protein, partial [Bacteroidota bacterium]